MSSDFYVNRGHRNIEKEEISLSFSLSVKNELCRHENYGDCCIHAELAAALTINGITKVSENNVVNIRIVTENAAFARRVFSQIKKTGDIIPDVIIRKSKKLKKHATYILTIASKADFFSLLDKTGLEVVNDKETGNTELVIREDKLFKEDRMNNNCCKKAFLRGAFLSGGAISDPEKTYHLEITSRNLNVAKLIKKMLLSFDLNAKIIKRKGSYVIYLKEGENIVDFLNIIGAHSSLLELENIRILKEMRNNVNRMVNCETANLEKTVNASVRQIENIKFLISRNKLKDLPESLREIAELRLKYSDASLAELGQHLTPALGKSGVNHRLRKIDVIAEKERKLYNIKQRKYLANYFLCLMLYSFLSFSAVTQN